MTAPRPAPGGPSAAADQAECWRQAARLRRQHPGWIVLWLAPAGCYRAYRRLPGTRRDTTLTDRTPDGLAAQISQAEHASRTPEQGKTQHDQPRR